MVSNRIQREGKVCVEVWASMDILKLIGQRLKEARETCGFKQEEVAQKIDHYLRIKYPTAIQSPLGEMSKQRGLNNAFDFQTKDFLLIS